VEITLAFMTQTLTCKNCCDWEAAKEPIKHSTNKEQREETRYNEVQQSCLRPEAEERDP